MNRGLIFAGGALIGAAAGCVGTYFYMKKLVDKQVSDEVEAFKASYDGHKRPHFEELDTGGITTVEQEMSEQRVLRHKSSIDNGPVKIKKKAYHKIAASYAKPSDILDEEEEEMPNEELNAAPEEDLAATVDTVPDGDISIITVEQFEDDNHHEKTSLIWFTENNVITDEFNAEVEDRELLLGDVLDGLKPSEEGFIYVRNNKAYVDYEIDVIFDSWEPEDF